MSENGPREGTRDLPRPSPESGRRSLTEDSPAGIAYSSIARALRRRTAELVALAEGGRSPSEVAQAYTADHPLEPAVTPDEVTTALANERAKSSKPAGSRS